MRKKVFIILSIITIMIGIFTSAFMMKTILNKGEKQKVEKIELAEKVTDDCIEEYNELEKQELEEADSEEEKVSPNAVVTFEKYYKGCEHTVTRYEPIQTNLVNSTKEQIAKKYDNWEIKEFTNNKIVLYQELDGECGEHYMLRDNNGKIDIYKLDEEGNEELINKTDISTEYLTETDKINMDNGLIVYGKESLNQLLEDFE